MADSRSLCFTSAPLAEGVEILGIPEIKLVMTSYKAEPSIAVCLKTQISQYIEPVTVPK